MLVYANGRQLELQDGATGETMLQVLELTPATVVAEVNGEVMPRQEFLGYPLKEDDRIELVTLVGGG